MNWLLADMNCYFASVEQMLRPELRGRPVGVIPVESDGTCVIAASYDAKQRGVKVGTRVPEARRLCPGIALVKARPPIYVEIHHRLLQTVERVAPVHKVYSIDEWTVRLLGPERDPERARAMALEIKRGMLEDFGPCLTCSIGIAPTRLLAKIASNLQKPDGLTLLPVSELPGRLEALSLGSLCGLGDGMLVRLERHGIRTVRDLWNISRQEAVRVWGSVSGAQWWAGFHGEDEPEVPTRRRSMTHGSVLEPRFRTAEGARGILIRLVCRLGQRLRRDGYFARSLRVSVRDVAGGLFSDSAEMPYAQDTSTLLWLFDRIWERRSPRSAAPLKVDVTVAGLVPASRVPRSLFADDEKRNRLSRTMDDINRRCGPLAIYPGPIHEFRHLMEDKIAFGRIPYGGE